MTRGSKNLPVISCCASSSFTLTCSHWNANWTVRRRNCRLQVLCGSWQLNGFIICWESPQAVINKYLENCEFPGVGNVIFSLRPKRVYQFLRDADLSYYTQTSIEFRQRFALQGSPRKRQKQTDTCTSVSPTLNFKEVIVKYPRELNLSQPSVAKTQVLWETSKDLQSCGFFAS